MLSVLQAGLPPGYIIQCIDCKTSQQFGEETLQLPPWNERNRHRQITGGMLSHLYGRAVEAVSIAYLDGKGAFHERRIVRAGREGRMVFDPTMPPFFAIAEWRDIHVPH